MTAENQLSECACGAKWDPAIQTHRQCPITREKAAVTSKEKLAPCPFCGTPDRIREVMTPQQALYTHDEHKRAILTPAGFAALDRYHEMTDKLEELIAENALLKSTPLGAVSQALICALKHADATTGEGLDALALRVLAEEIRRLSHETNDRDKLPVEYLRMRLLSAAQGETCAAVHDGPPPCPHVVRLLQEAADRLCPAEKAAETLGDVERDSYIAALVDISISENLSRAQMLACAALNRWSYQRGVRPSEKTNEPIGADEAGRKAYVAYVDSQEIHGNRFPAWSELDQWLRDEWIRKTVPRFAAPSEDGNG